jgi:hypothetical protein
MWAKTVGKSSGSWARAVRIIWDKHATGENRRKWKQTDEIPKCELCLCATSQRHTITVCGKAGLRGIRSRAVQRFREAVGKAKIGTAARAVLDVLAALLEHETAVTIWTGVWSPEVRAAVAEVNREMSAREYNRVVTALTHLVKGVDEMYSMEAGGAPTRGVRKEPDWRRQTLITDYVEVGAKRPLMGAGARAAAGDSESGGQEDAGDEGWSETGDEERLEELVAGRRSGRDMAGDSRSLDG